MKTNMCSSNDHPNLLLHVHICKPLLYFVSTYSVHSCRPLLPFNTQAVSNISPPLCLRTRTLIHARIYILYINSYVKIILSFLCFYHSAAHDPTAAIKMSTHT